MHIKDVKIGQTVKILPGHLFYGWVVGKTGVVTDIEGDYVTVKLEDGEEDYGYSAGVELVIDVLPVGVVSAATVKEAIANVEAALAVLKGLVG